MVKITIIDVNIGISVDDIVANNLKELTTSNKLTIDNIVSETKAKQDALIAIKELRTKKDQENEQQLSTLYQLLLQHSSESPKSYLPTQEILNAGMANMISFVGKMRNWLKNNNKQEKLTPIKGGYRLDAMT